MFKSVLLNWHSDKNRGKEFSVVYDRINFVCPYFQIKKGYYEIFRGTKHNFLLMPFCKTQFRNDNRTFYSNTYSVKLNIMLGTFL